MVCKRVLFTLLLVMVGSLDVYGIDTIQKTIYMRPGEIASFADTTMISSTGAITSFYKVVTHNVPSEVVSFTRLSADVTGYKGRWLAKYMIRVSQSAAHGQYDFSVKYDWNSDKSPGWDTIIQIRLVIQGPVAIMPSNWGKLKGMFR